MKLRDLGATVSLRIAVVSSLHLLFSELVSVLAPARCMQCLEEDTWLCQDCLAAVRSPVLSCIGCRKESPRGLTCRDCLSEIPITGLVSAAPYVSPYIRRGIHWLKFKGVQEVAAPLAQLMTARLPAIAPLQQLASEATLVPIPLHKQRARQRGFNQSELIASHMSSLTGIPISHVLERTRLTHTQAKLSHELRSRNLQSAFTLREVLPLHIRYVLLLDDVATSGATLVAAAKALRSHFAGNIWAVTVARG